MRLDPEMAAQLAADLDASMVDVMRPLATALQQTPADVWRNPDASGGKRAAPVFHHASAGARLVTPDAHGLQLLADLGASRANRIGSLAWDEDILEGDELHVGSVIYQVERVAVAAHKTLVALWELKS